MRLINATTLDFEEFHGDDIPKYAILSHTWDTEEVTFQEWERDRKACEAKAGYAKIRETCRLALRDGLNYAWVDTNCIDKRSSAELSEAINSMFAWYGNAVVCYAFLSDVEVGGGRGAYDGDDDRGLVDDYGLSDDLEFQARFRKSRWFTRGWTLQELLAPITVIFYSREWIRLGAKSSYLTGLISDITGIDPSYLVGYSRTPMAAASIALRMFWLSQRKTTRVEDMAYCMLGIFDINMPLLYGEGTKAFVRLQEEIIKVSVDHTIFCWTWTDPVSPEWQSLPAPSPDTFQKSRDFFSENTLGHASPYSMTNEGLSIHLPIIQAWSYNFVVLSVRHRRRSLRWRACIPLKALLRPSVPGFLGTYRRASYPSAPFFMPVDWALQEINIFVKSNVMSSPYAFRLKSNHESISRCLLITLGNGLPSWIPVPMNSTKKLNTAFQCETYPSELFLESRSIFKLHHRIQDGYGGLLALRDETSGCVVFIYCKIDDPRRTRWFCHILPSRFWADDEIERAKLLDLLVSKVAGVTGESEIRMAVCEHIGACFVIDRDGDGRDLDWEDRGGGWWLRDWNLVCIMMGF
ncbi:hypothetical protein NHQ30_005957 [Ciborinia camelliae]|nr:hypothetical protein NHQ30_005957 [Ciborinia camelliae]